MLVLGQFVQGAGASSLLIAQSSFTVCLIPTFNKPLNEGKVGVHFLMRDTKGVDVCTILISIEFTSDNIPKEIPL